MLVTCTAVDEADNESLNSFSISVMDSTPPVIDGVPSDQEVPWDGSDPVVAWEPPTAIDVVDGNTPVTCDPPSGSTFPAGSTEVICRAEDVAGNTGQVSFFVTVPDDAGEPPPDPDAGEEPGEIADSGGGPTVSELPDTAMAPPPARPGPLASIGLLLLAGSAIGLARAGNRRLAASR